MKYGLIVIAEFFNVCVHCGWGTIGFGVKNKFLGNAVKSLFIVSFISVRCDVLAGSHCKIMDFV